MTTGINNLSEAINSALADILPIFNLQHKFVKVKVEDRLELKQEVNVLLGITGVLKGTFTLSLSKSAAMKLASAMMGGTEVNALDDMPISAVCEFANMLGGTTISKIQSKEPVDMSPPTLVMAEREVVLLNRLKSHSLIYSILDEEVIISYSLGDVVR